MTTPIDPMVSEGRTRTTSEYPTRATPLGAVSIRGSKAPGLRLFGVASLEHHDGSPSLAAGTQLVTFRDVGAIVASSPYSSDGLTPSELELYCTVVAEAFGRHSVVPAPPGAVFRSRERLLGWLELHYYVLAEAIDFIADRVVARVTVHRGNASAIEAEANAVPPVMPPTSLRLTPTLDDDDVRPYAAGDLVSLAADAFRDLRREAAALIVLRAGPDTAAADESAHGSFLLERSRWHAFTEAVTLQSRRHGALRLECTGPWPPYDFVRMQLTA